MQNKTQKFKLCIFLILSTFLSYQLSYLINFLIKFLINFFLSTILTTVFSTSRIRQFPPKILISVLPDAPTNCLHPASDNRNPEAVIRGGRQKTIIDVVEQIVIVANKF
jgi:hypothetical protein